MKATRRIYRRDIVRFIPKFVVDSTTGCWTWQACTSEDGYGTFAVGGSKYMLAHRWAYQEWVGALDAELTIDHLGQSLHRRTTTRRSKKKTT